MSATKSDYEAIAAAIRKTRDGYAPTWNPNLFRALDDVSRSLADGFAKNPKFDRAEFLRNCGVSP